MRASGILPEGMEGSGWGGILVFLCSQHVAQTLSLGHPLITHRIELKGELSI